MENQVTDVLQQAIPPYEQAIHFVVILLAALVIDLAIRNAGKMARAVAFPLSVIGLTFAGTFLAPPWGIAAGADAAAGRRITAWFLFWAVVLAVRFIDALAGAICERRKTPFPIPILLRRSIVAAIYLVAAFATMKYVLGVDITPFLATSAILTMVIGLALQGVLGNLLSGMSLNLVRTVETGNLIRVGDDEGIVVHTNWRETVIRTRNDDYIHVPNTLLASGMITNFSKPAQAHMHSLDVGASYSDAPADVIDALVEAAREATLTLDHPAPTAELIAYLDFGINYRLFFWSKNYWSKSRVEGEVGRLIWYKFKRRGIEIPFPMSDQLLNDFMAVVYNQRRLPPDGEETERMARLLGRSAFLRRPAAEGEEASPLLDDDALRRLARSCRIVRFTKGETLCTQGEVGESCYVVARGSIDGSIEYREKGRTERFTFKAKEGDLFGEMSLFTGMARTATGRITEETELVEIPGDAFARLLAEREEVMEEIASMVARRNEENEVFLAKIESIPEEVRTAGRDSNVVLKRLRRLAAWGKKLLDGDSKKK